MNRGEYDTNLRSLQHAIEQGWTIVSIEPKRLSEITVLPEPQGDIEAMTLAKVEESLAAGHDFALDLEESRNPPLVIGCYVANPINEIVTPTAQMGDWVFKYFEMPGDHQVLAQLLKPSIVWDYEVYFDKGVVWLPPCTNPQTGCTCEWVGGLALHEIPLVDISESLFSLVD